MKKFLSSTLILFFFAFSLFSHDAHSVSADYPVSQTASVSFSWLGKAKDVAIDVGVRVLDFFGFGGDAETPVTESPKIFIAPPVKTTSTSSEITDAVNRFNTILPRPIYSISESGNGSSQVTNITNIYNSYPAVSTIVRSGGGTSGLARAVARGDDELSDRIEVLEDQYQSLSASSGSEVWSLSGLDAYYSSGNVGIGTSTPSAELGVVGDGLFTGNITAATFYGDGSNLTGITSFSTSTTRSVLSSSATGITYNSSTGDFSLTSGYNIPLTASTTAWNNGISQWTTNGTSVYYSGGNVGVGTSTPSSKLDVWGNLKVGTSSTPTLFANTASGKVMIGASTPLGSEKLLVQGAGGIMLYDGSGSAGTIRPETDGLVISSSGADLAFVGGGSPEIYVTGAIHSTGDLIFGVDSVRLHEANSGVVSLQQFLSSYASYQDVFSVAPTDGSVSFLSSISAPIVTGIEIYGDVVYGNLGGFELYDSYQYLSNAQVGSLQVYGDGSNAYITDYDGYNSIDIQARSLLKDVDTVLNWGSQGVLVTAPSGDSLGLDTFSSFSVTGGAPSGNDASRGGDIILTAGGSFNAGGAKNIGSNGGNITLTSGVGQSNDSNTAGSGGDITLQTGFAGSGQGGDGRSGYILLNPLNGYGGIGRVAIGTSTLTSSLLTVNARSGLSANFLGSVAIGTSTSPSVALLVSGNGQFTGVGSAAAANDLRITSTGVLTTNTSDARLKENLESFSSSTLDKVLQLKPYYYTWIGDNSGKRDLGFLAQDVAEIFPETTFINSTDGYMGINYSRFPAILVKALQELAHKVSFISKWFAGDGDALKVQGDICVDDVCVTKDQFKALLQGAGGNINTPPPSDNDDENSNGGNSSEDTNEGGDAGGDSNGDTNSGEGETPASDGGTTIDDSSTENSGGETPSDDTDLTTPPGDEDSGAADTSDEGGTPESSSGDSSGTGL